MRRREPGGREELTGHGADLVRAELCGACDLDPPLAVDVGVGDDWNEAKS